jgi:signal peptidase I
MAAEKTASQEWREIASTIFWGLLIALALRIVLFQPYTIPSSSMEPGLRTGDYIVVSKYSYGWSRASVPFNPPLPGGRVFAREPRRGEVVVFRLPRSPSEVYVKRLIGLPGDRVAVRGGVIFVNGEAIEQTLIGPTNDPDEPAQRVVQLSERRSDGTAYVTFDRGQGREGDDTALTVVPEGHYFMIGDNRDNSLDSRWPTETGVGFVPADNIIGKAQFVMVSWNAGASVFKPWTWLDLRGDRLLRKII